MQRGAGLGDSSDVAAVTELLCSSLTSSSVPLSHVQLVDEAYQRWLTEEEGVVDDITAVVVKFVQ